MLGRVTHGIMNQIMEEGKKRFQKVSYRFNFPRDEFYILSAIRLGVYFGILDGTRVRVNANHIGEVPCQK